jgi:hypothetical protein
LCGLGCTGSSQNQLKMSVTRLRINKKDKHIPVASATVLIQLVWELPGKATETFRRQSAHVIAHYLGADRTLVAEIEATNKSKVTKKVNATSLSDNSTQNQIQEPTDNPVRRLNLMNIKPEHFHGCNMKDGVISIYDAIVAFKGCTKQRAREIFNTEMKKAREILNTDNFIKTKQFPRSDGVMGRGVPCCTFTNLLKILSQVPGEEGRCLRVAQVEISNRVTTGDVTLIKCIQDRGDQRRGTKSLLTHTILYQKESDETLAAAHEQAAAYQASLVTLQAELKLAKHQHQEMKNENKEQTYIIE